MTNRKQFFKFGMGAWGIGGFKERNPKNDDEKQVKALAYMFGKGINFVETCLWYAQGHSSFLVAKALKGSGVRRENVFITQTIYPYELESIMGVEEEFDRCLELFEMDYVDALQISQLFISKFGFDETVGFITKWIDEGRVRYASITNANLELLKKYHQEFGDKLFAHEAGLNFEVRENESLGIMDYALENDILNVVYQPLRRNRTAAKNYPLLVELAEKYGKAQNQIILNWIVAKGFLPITKSETIEHIDEYLAAFDFEIGADDLKRMDDFKVSGYKSPKIDWDGSGDGVLVSQLSNVFDELVER